jgi:hypothetical protein
MAFPVKTGVMRAFPDSLAYDFTQSRSWRDRPGRRGMELLMRSGGNHPPGFNPRSSARLKPLSLS